ncbi:hypothetical protein TNCV_487221 [Trichonephila clavipes]|nr:hypothetical protein TNCV_487221 [Trichonephila clavipes]
MFDPSSFLNPTPLAHADTSRDVLPRGGTSQRCIVFPTRHSYTAKKNGRKKQDMLQLAEELGINATLNMTVPSIKIAITNSEGYEEEFVKNLYETIIANGKDWKS